MRNSSLTRKSRNTWAVLCSAATALTVLSGVQFTSTAADSEPSKYSDMNNWAYFAEGKDKDVDVFFIAPTVDTKDEAKMDINDEKNRERFVGALEMERGILNENARLYEKKARLSLCSITIRV